MKTPANSPVPQGCPVSRFWQSAGIMWAVCLSMAPSAAVAAGLLCVHPDNPQYFTDESGRAIHLAGHQWFNDVQPTAWDYAHAGDWDSYLAYVNERGLNYLRNWIIWSTGDPRDDVPSPIMPFARTGPGVAVDGLPKFDLTRFDDDFFETLTAQVTAAGKRNVFVSIMLFDVYGFLGPRGKEKSPGYWQGNLFRGENNIQKIDVDADKNGQGMEFFYTDDPQVRDIQRRYVRKMVESLNACDNVFFEIANELRAPEWQLEIVKVIRDAEATLPRRHLIYLSPGGRDRAGRWSILPQKFFTDSPADVIAITRSWDRNYFGNPPANTERKPVFMDLDHVAAELNGGDNEWNNNPLMPWKSFTRGYHVCLYDADYWKPASRREAWEATRRSCGATARLAARLDLAKMQPRPDLASSEYCLANAGVEYVVLQPEAGDITVRDLVVGKQYDVEWLSLTSSEPVARSTHSANEPTATLSLPQAPAVLYLKRQ